MAQFALPETDAKIILLLKAGERERQVEQVDAVLAASPDAGVYQRGHVLVQPVRIVLRAAGGRTTCYTELEPLNDIALAAVLDRVAKFKKWDARARDKYVPADCPLALAAAYLVRARWSVPTIIGLASSPTLKPDGVILDQPGFDHETGLLYEPNGATFPRIADNLTHDDAVFALEDLKEAIATFPFVDAVDRAVALSAIMSVVLRCSINAAPMHAFTAPTPGTGKSLLADVTTAIGLGARCTVMTPGGTKEEMEKRIDAALLAARPVVSFDNCERPLGGDKLCQAITQDYIDVRVLGQSRNLRTVASTLFFATGNNLRLKGDLTRRALLCKLDAHCEAPENREFDRNAYEYALARRPRLVADCLTITRAFLRAGAPQQRTPLGSFENWSRLVRDPLIWAGAADPADSIAGIKADDPERETAAVFIDAFAAVLPDDYDRERGLSAGDIIKRVAANDALREAVASVAADRKGALSAVLLGHYLKRLRGRIIDGRSIEIVKTVRHANYWTVRKV